MIMPSTRNCVQVPVRCAIPKRGCDSRSSASARRSRCCRWSRWLMLGGRRKLQRAGRRRCRVPGGRPVAVTDQIVSKAARQLHKAWTWKHVRARPCGTTWTCNRQCQAALLPRRRPRECAPPPSIRRMSRRPCTSRASQRRRSSAASTCLQTVSAGMADRSECRLTWTDDFAEDIARELKNGVRDIEDAQLHED